MKKFLFPLFLMLALLIAGCGGDDNGTDPNGNGDTPPQRLVVDTTVVAPTLTDVDEAVWSSVSPKAIEIGGSSTYGINGTLGNQNVTMKAILKSNILYIRAEWHDPNPNVWGNYTRCSNGAAKTWEEVITEGQDIFSVIFDAQDNGDEKADCATMCHATDMKTTGGGHADVWKWMSTQTAPVRMAEDYWWDATGVDDDATINLYPYRPNFLNATPKYMHTDELAFTGPYLFHEDTVVFSNLGVDWTTGYKMPGYILDSTIFNDPIRTTTSLNDVQAISHFDSSSSSSSDYTWTVVFARALNTTHDDDVNLATLDSVQITVAATHNDSKASVVTHSGSEPLWLILK